MATTGVQFVDNLILAFNRISNEKKETFIKLLILSIAAILCELNVYMCAHVYRYNPAAFSTRLFAVLRFESVIHEFDP